MKSNGKLKLKRQDRSQCRSGHRKGGRSPWQPKQAPKAITGPREVGVQVRVMAGHLAQRIGGRWLNNDKCELGKLREQVLGQERALGQWVKKP